jgi:uncharacterized membrane protein YkoI
VRYRAIPPDENVPPIMNKLLRFLAASGCLAALMFGPTAKSAAAEEKKSEAVGSIRPKGEVAPADLPGLAKITFQQAMTAALAKVKGSIIKAELEVEDGNLMYSFEIVGANKKITEVEIDAGNGKVLGTEDVENEKEDEPADAKKK